MSTENLKELRNALSCWQDDYDCDDDKEQYDMLGAAIDAISRLEVAERANSAQSDHINQQQDRIDSLEQKNAALGNALGTEDRERDDLRAERDGAMESSLAVADAWVRRAKDAEAELARRDAAAGEPVAWVCGDEEIRDFKAGREVTIVRDCDDSDLEYLPLYTAASPAVLPPELSFNEALQLMHEYTLVGDANSFLMGANLMRQQCLELGAKQQKVVELPEIIRHELIDVLTWIERLPVPTKSAAAKAIRLRKAINDIDTAGVKWEVKK